ncbi:MAG: D-alanyl-D-alanine carboxypeptidase family protein [Pseudomonadota bacterium]
MYRPLPYLSIILMLFIGLLTDRLHAQPFVVADMDTGEILQSNNMHQRWYPASLTKLMTAYVTFQAIKAGEIYAGSPVTISKAASRQPPSRMGYKQGVQIRIDTALKIIIIKSANDVSLALAEAVAGSLEAFIKRMNAQAERLGLTNSQFANSNGLHNANQFSSARDMAVLSARIMNDFPQYGEFYRAVAIKTPVRTHYSYNLLLERLPGTTGMKTGFVCASGYNMVATATLNGRRLVAVVLGRESQTDRAVSAAKLLRESVGANGNTNIFTEAPKGNAPRNMRPVLCTQEARAQRYDPAAGNAVIKSKFLSPRQKSNLILAANPGGVDSPPGNAWLTRKFTLRGSIPVPRERPDFDPSTGKILLVAIGRKGTGSVAMPTPRPR